VAHSVGREHGVTLALKPELEFRNPGYDSARKGSASDENTFLLLCSASRQDKPGKGGSQM